MPETSPAGAVRPSPYRTLSLARELGVLLCLSVMFPFVIHILPVPETARLGPRLLPMFYAPLLAVLWGRSPSAFVVALTAPWLNWVLTSHPAPLGAVTMTVELLGFVCALRALVARTGARGFLAVAGYLSAMAVAVVVVAIFPVLINGQAAFAWAAQSVATGVPGIAVLFLINEIAVRCRPPGASGGGPAPA